jgi:Flp pilus assembly protein protease CpaA
VRYLSEILLIVFALIISFEDLKRFRISNKLLISFLLLLSIQAVLTHKLFVELKTGLSYLLVFSFLFLLISLTSRKSRLGFGDVKLIAVLAFGYINVGYKSAYIFIVALWISLLIQLILEMLVRRKFSSHMAMAPSIFFAVGLYLYAPIGLLLSQ